MVTRLTGPPTDPEEKRTYECNAEPMKTILCGLSDDASSKVNRCKSTKNIWDKLKKLYGDELFTTESDYGNKKNNRTYRCTDDKRRLYSSCSEDVKEAWLLMAHETSNVEKTSNYDCASQSKKQDPFGSDEEEREIEVEVDLEGELMSALEELKNVRREYKYYKKSVQEKCDQLSKCLEESNKNINTLTAQLEEAKGMCEGINQI